MFEDGKCPMLLSDVIQEYGLSDSFIQKFCSYGCSIKCGQILKECLEKKRMRPCRPQISAAPADCKAAGESSG